MEEDLFEQSTFEEAHTSGEVLQIPNNARTIAGTTQRLLVIGPQLNKVNHKDLP